MDGWMDDGWWGTNNGRRGTDGPWWGANDGWEGANDRRRGLMDGASTMDFPVPPPSHIL
jgi:hypothetical protein